MPYNFQQSPEFVRVWFDRDSTDQEWTVGIKGETTLTILGMWPRRAWAVEYAERYAERHNLEVRVENEGRA